MILGAITGVTVAASMIRGLLVEAASPGPVSVGSTWPGRRCCRCPGSVAEARSGVSTAAAAVTVWRR